MGERTTLLPAGAAAGSAANIVARRRSIARCSVRLFGPNHVWIIPVCSHHHWESASQTT